MKLPKGIREFVELLRSENVEFLPVDGCALAFHGAPRFTEDIDFYILPEPDNAAKLMRVVNRFGLGHLELSEEDFLKPNYIVQLGMAPHRVDLLTGIDGAGWKDAWDSREPVNLDGLEAMMIGRDALIRNKKTSGRTQDLADAEKLEAHRDSLSVG